MTGTPEPDPQVVEEFLMEAEEAIAEIEAGLLDLENDPEDRERVDDIFRPIHSMKGVAGFLGFAGIEGLCHAGEDLLARVRRSERTLGEKGVERLLEMVDELRQRVERLREEGASGLIDDAGPVALIEALQVEACRKPEEESPPEGESRGGGEDPFVTLRATGLAPCDFLEADLALLSASPNDRTLRDQARTVLGQLRDAASAAGADPIELLAGRMAEAVERLEQAPEEGRSSILESLGEARMVLYRLFEGLPRLDPEDVSAARGAAEGFVTAGDPPSGGDAEEWLGDEDFFRAVEGEVESLRQQIEELVQGDLEAVPRMRQCLHLLEPRFRDRRFDELTELVNCLDEAVVEIEERPSSNRQKWVRVLRTLLERLERSLLDRMHERVPALVSKRMIGEILLDRGHIDRSDIETALSHQASKRKLGEILVDEGMITSNELEQAVAEQRQNTKRRTRARSLKAAGQSMIRVDERKLDSFMSLVAELTMVKNRLVHLADPQVSLAAVEGNEGSLDRVAGEVSRIANEMQSLVLELRMVPVRRIFERIPRLIRDLGRQLEKRVRVEFIGEETEIDRVLVEKIFDPLVHLVRNAMDHGLEVPAERVAAGKSEVGNLSVSAGRDGDSTYIEVSDDGAGIDPRRIVRKAISRGIASAEDLGSRNDREIVEMIFHPGFSTAETVSEVSGRGVGLDVVQRNIEELKGEIRITSELGKGTTFRIELPLTLAVDVALLLEAGGQTFALPMDSVVETIKVPQEDLDQAADTGVLLHRNRPLAIADLHDLLGIEAPKVLPRNVASRDRPIVIVERGEETLGVVVSRFLHKRDIVVKPLEGGIEEVPGFEGATVLGNGNVVLILSAGDLIRIATDRVA